jgi:pimeloyl-ACP methyl ester carboxylesterase
MDKDTSKVVIYDSQYMRVIRNASSGSHLYVTFNEMELSVSRMKNNEFWGYPLFHSMDVPAIGFVSTGKHWYPEHVTRDAIEIVRQIIAERGYSRVITYGHSMGGYAALRYGAALGADVAIAFCPQYSIAPSDVGEWDRRYIQNYALHGGEDMLLKGQHLPKQTYVAHDPNHRQDARHAAYIERLGSVSLITMPFTGHDSVRLLAQSGAAPSFLAALAQTTSSASLTARHIIRRHRRRTPLYWRSMGQMFWQRRKDLEAAEQCFITAVSLAPQEATARLQLARLAISQKQHDKALRHLQKMPPLRQLDRGQLERIVHVYESLGLLEQALRAATVRVQKSPNDPQALAQLEKVRLRLNP